MSCKPTYKGERFDSIDKLKYFVAQEQGKQSVYSYVPIGTDKALKGSTLLEGIKRHTNNPLLKQGLKVLENTVFKAFVDTELAIFSKNNSFDVIRYFESECFSIY